ncbi:hypothetical protein CDAR_423001 [Caerostris darwini]|uniref:Uncharacterized protein n=1 Tax=Caerostris darwini TaxID=1538125 RepID=A0AAV4TGU6_9ARAC|nr:hypothetical protein CDAR_423001 [Caerostris darwini]
MVTLHAHGILIHIDAAGSWWTTDGNTADHSKSPRPTDRKVSTDHRLSSRLIFAFFFHYRYRVRGRWKGICGNKGDCFYGFGRIRERSE